MPVLYLTEADVQQILTMEMALPAVESAFRKLGLDEAENGPRQRCQTDLAMLHILPAAAKTLGALGYKAYTTSKEGARFHVTLYDAKKGQMIGLMEADTLGQFRTGAASGLATKFMANPDAKTVGIYGTGKQARTQLLAICQVRPIERIHVYGRDADRRKQFAEAMSSECQCEVVAVDNPEQAARDMAIVVTATTSREPVLMGEWLAEGTHVNLIGSNFMAKTESDVEVFRRAGTIAVDNKEQARAEAGGLCRAAATAYHRLAADRLFIADRDWPGPRAE